MAEFNKQSGFRADRLDNQDFWSSPQRCTTFWTMQVITAAAEDRLVDD